MTENYDTIIDESALEGAYVRVPLFVLHDERLGASAIRLYMHLKSYAYGGACFPGVKKLAMEWGTDITTVRRQLRILEDVGLVETKPRVGTSSVYVLKLMSRVYFKSVEPPVLVDSFVASIRKRGMVERFERSLNMDIGYEDKDLEEQEIPVAEPVAERSKKKSDEPLVPKTIRRVKSGAAQKIIDAIGDSDDKASTAKANALHNRRLRKKLVKGESAEEVVSEDGDLVENRVTANTIEACWKSVCRECIPKNGALLHPWGIVDKARSKKLIERWGGDNLVYYVDYIVRNWSNFMTRYKNVPGAPSMQIIAHYADMWFSEIEEGRDMRPLSPKQIALREGEFRDGNEEKEPSTLSFL